MTSHEQWQADQDWAQVETLGWLQKSLEIDVPGPDDPGTAETLGAISQSLERAGDYKPRIGALLMQLTFAARVLVHMLAETTGETPAQVLDRLWPGPPDPGRTIGGAPRA